MDILYTPWPWYVSGPLISIIMLLLLYFGKSFGISENLRTICSIAGGKRFTDYFKVDIKSRIWNLVFLVGTIIGGFITSRYLTTSTEVDLNPKTVNQLKELGFQNPGAEFLPPELFSSSEIMSVKGILILLVGGLLVGFGTRYAGGCTSGHAISGLSNLQVPSLIAVIGFFIGGLTMVHFIFPLLF